MSLTVTLQNKPNSNWNIEVNNQSGSLVPATGYPTAPNYTTVGVSQSIAGLQDVNLTSIPPVNGSTLVYNSQSGKYDVTVIPSLDGGSF
jgi:hypothetical protein